MTRAMIIPRVSSIATETTVMNTVFQTSCHHSDAVSTVL